MANKTLRIGFPSLPFVIEGYNMSEVEVRIVGGASITTVRGLKALANKGTVVEVIADNNLVGEFSVLGSGGKLHLERKD